MITCIVCKIQVTNENYCADCEEGPFCWKCLEDHICEGEGEEYNHVL